MSVSKIMICHFWPQIKLQSINLLTLAPIFADVSDAFGHIILHPDTALSCQIFLYKSKEDFMPTIDLTKAIVDENNEPILYPLVYSNSSFGTKDLPMIFGYAMTQCVKFYKEYSSVPLGKKILKRITSIIIK